MTIYFWVNGTGNSSDATNHIATSSGGSPNVANVPTLADDLIFDSASNATAYTFTMDATFTCKNLTFSNPPSGKVTWAGSATFNCYGSLTLAVNGGVMTRTYSGAINWKGTTTGLTIDTKGITMGSPSIFDGVSGEWTLQNTYNPAGQNTTLTSGNLKTNGQVFGATNIIVVANGLAKGLDLTGSTCQFGSFIVSDLTNFTFVSTGSTINFINSLQTLITCGASGVTGLTFNNVTVTADSCTITGINTFTALTLTKNATVSAGTFLTDNITVTGAFVAAGNNANTTRMLIASNTENVQKTITAGTVTVSNTDFRSIVGAGAGSWNLSAVSSGDCGNNSGITFKSVATHYLKTAVSISLSASANYYAATNGAGGNTYTPLPQDTTIVDLNSITAGSIVLTQDMFRIGSINFTGVTNVPTFLTTQASEVYGSITLVAPASLNLSGTGAWTFRGASPQTLTSDGQTLAKQIIPRSNGSTFSFSDSCISTANLNCFAGTANFGSFNHTFLGFTSSGTNIRTVNMNSSNVTITGTTGNVLNFSGTGQTFNAGTGSITLNDTGAVAKTFAGNGMSFNTVNFAADNVTITGANTFNTLAINTAGLTNGLKLTAGITQTFTTLTTNGSVGNLAKLLSSSAGSPATLARSGSTNNIFLNYLSLKDITITGSTWFYAGLNSTNVSGNTGWYFLNPPTGLKDVYGDLLVENIKQINGVNLPEYKAKFT